MQSQRTRTSEGDDLTSSGRLPLSAVSKPEVACAAPHRLRGPAAVSTRTTLQHTNLGPNCSVLKVTVYQNGARVANPDTGITSRDTRNTFTCTSCGGVRNARNQQISQCAGVCKRNTDLSSLYCSVIMKQIRFHG